MAKRTKYTAEDIQVLDYPENIQRRPGMYVGGRGSTALHHLAVEVIDNAVDEALAGQCKEIDVVIQRDGSITISDSGWGIPTGIHPEKDRSALELAFTELHSGAKFEEGTYSTSGGVHGVGVKATNALSQWLVVTVRRDGVLYRQRHERGLPVTPVQILDPHSEEVIGEVGVRGEKKAIKEHKDRRIGTGTTVSFEPNPEFLDVVGFDFARLARRLQMVSFLLPGLTTQIRDLRRKRKQELSYQYNGGLLEYVEYLNRDRRVIHKDAITIKGEENGTQVEVVLQWHSGDDEEVLSFVNTIPTSDGGRHVAGFQAAVTRAIKQFASERRENIFKEADKITGRDTSAGLTVVMHVRMADPQFTSQTKTQLGGEAVQGQVHKVVYEALLNRLRRNISLGRTIVERCVAASRARKAAAKARELVIRRSVLDVAEETGLPGKLADVSKGTPTEETTLFIVEGDSAGGSCKQARDRRFHGILPLRGKILNVEGVRLPKALSNAEIRSIIAAVGAGVGRDFDVTQMRYGRVCILTDADVDGEHIRTLLLTFFWRLMRDMIESGDLFIALPPLYLLRRGKESRYAYTDAERDRIMAQWGNRATVQRYKGLGEMNPEQLRETVFQLGQDNPAVSPHMVRVTVEDAHAANAAIGLWMGGSAERRRERLMRFWDETAVGVENNDVEGKA